MHVGVGGTAWGSCSVSERNSRVKAKVEVKRFQRDEALTGPCSRAAPQSHPANTTELRTVGAGRQASRAGRGHSSSRSRRYNPRPHVP